jgi:hypothetical protein
MGRPRDGRPQKIPPGQNAQRTRKPTVIAFQSCQVSACKERLQVWCFDTPSVYSYLRERDALHEISRKNGEHKMVWIQERREPYAKNPSVQSRAALSVKYQGSINETNAMRSLAHPVLGTNSKIQITQTRPRESVVIIRSRYRCREGQGSGEKVRSRPSHIPVWAKRGCDQHDLLVSRGSLVKDSKFEIWIERVEAPASASFRESGWRTRPLPAAVAEWHPTGLSTDARSTIDGRLVTKRRT